MGRGGGVSQKHTMTCSFIHAESVPDSSNRLQPFTLTWISAKTNIGISSEHETDAHPQTSLMEMDQTSSFVHLLNVSWLMYLII